MSNIGKKTAVLLLEDGKVYNGYAAGKIGTSVGEICFNTGMTGYQEIFTDPSYFGQIMVSSNIHVGNYGVMSDEQQSHKIQISGLVCKKFSPYYSRKVAEMSIDNYFIEQSVVAIESIDTRSLIKHIRSKGAMNGIISSEIDNLDELKIILNSHPSMAGRELSTEVSTQTSYLYGNEHGKRVAVLDLGIKKSILDNLSKCNLQLKVYPAKTTFEEMEADFLPDGYFISNGPGDPSTMGYAIDTVTKVIQSNKPMFGICLGHQMLALSMGLKTYKMHNGHRGINHPVKNLINGKCEITSQNHGFAVVSDDFNSDKLEITHINLNDNTIEGLRIKDKKVFSVQYHPEASPGPHDSHYLFRQFEHLLNN